MEKYIFFIKEIIRKLKLNTKLIKKVGREGNKQQKKTKQYMCNMYANNKSCIISWKISL